MEQEMIDYAASVRSHADQKNWSEKDIKEDTVEEMIHRHGSSVAQEALEITEKWT